MRFEIRFLKTQYKEALKLKNKLMFAKLVKNPRIRATPNGWAVTYEAKKWVSL